MALTAQATNFVSDVQQLSGTLIPLSEQIDRLIARYNLNGFSNLVDADIQAAFPGLTKAKLIAAVTSLQALQTSFGDFVSGNRVNFIEMQV